MTRNGHHVDQRRRRHVPQASLPAFAEPCHDPEPRRRRRVLLVCLVIPMMGSTSWGSTTQNEPSPDDSQKTKAQAGKERKGRGGFGGGRHGRGHGGGFWNRMSDTEKEELWAFMEEHFPRMYIELQRARETDPKRFAWRVGRVLHDLREMMDLMETQPERALLMIQERKAHFEMRRSARQYHRATDPEVRDKARERLRGHCATAFDCRHSRREMEILELEIRIEELKQRHAEAAKMRDKLIDQEVDEILERGPGHGRRGGKHRSGEARPGRGGP